MKRIAAPLAVLAALAALSACQTAGRVAGALNPFDGDDDRPSTSNVPEEGRVSILTFEQELAPASELAGRAIVTPPAAALQNWNNPGGTPDNSPVHVAAGGGLDIVWRQGLGAGSSRDLRVSAPPVISEGKLYFIDAEHEVVAVDAATGDRLWSRRLRPRDEDGRRDRQALGGGLAADGGRVFVATGFGFIAALDGASGEEVWRAQAGAPFHASPTVANARVYAVSNDSRLVAIDAASGNVLWNYSAIAEPARILAASSPAVDGDTVIAPFASGEVVALLVANGRRLWVDSLSRSGRLTSLSAINDIAGRPAVEGGVVYAASHSGVLAAIDLRTGQRIWARGFASTQTPWIAGDVLYAINTDGELAAFDRATGNAYWVRQLRRFEEEEERRGRIAWTGPILAGGKLYLANSLGDIVTVAPETGEVVGQAEAGGPIFIPPIAAGGQVYFVTDEARLIAVR